MIALLTEDESLGIREIGLAAWMYYKERFSFDEAMSRFSKWGEGDLIEYAWNRLAERRLLSETDTQGVFTIAEAPKKRSALENQFEEFRKTYAGKKTGHNTMLNVLKKHKDWKSIIPLLLPAYEREISYRASLEAKRQMGVDVFIPMLANLSTWLNQRRWEMEYPETNPVSSPQQEHAGRYGEYAKYMRERIPEIPYLLSFDQYEAWCNKTGPFVGLNMRMAERYQKEFFWQAHQRLVNQPKEVERMGGLYQAIVTVTKA